VGSSRAGAAARRAVRAISADLPEPLREQWLTRLDVQALLDT